MKQIRLLLAAMMMAFVFAPEMWAQATREAYAVVSTDTDGKTLTFYYNDQKGSQSGAYDIPWSEELPGWGNGGDKELITKVTFDLSFDDYHGLTNAYGMFAKLTQLATIENLSYLHTENVTNMASMFFSCRSLTSLDLSGFNTSNVTDMNCMFYGTDLQSLELSGFDTSNVTDMNGMFGWCTSLSSLDLSWFDTSTVTNMKNMFDYCISLSTLDLSGFDTSKVTDMSYMFSECKSLSPLDLSGFDTSNVTNMSSMFAACESLSTLDLSGFNTSKVTDMNGMFACSALQSLNLSGFDTSNVTDMSGMFHLCISLSSLDLSGFDTSSVTNMYNMFDNCHSLTSLDLSGFDTSKVTDMNYMFFQCSKLETIYCNRNWSGGSVTSSDNMFSGCTKLKGAATYANGNANDITFANPTTGYFTWIEIVPKPVMLTGALIPSKGWFMQFIDDGSTYIRTTTETKVFKFPKGSNVVITVQNLSKSVFDLHLMVNGVDRINDLVVNEQGNFELHLNNVKQGLVIEAKYENKETSLGICSSKGGRIFANYTRSDNDLVRDDTSFDGDGMFIPWIKPGTDVTLTFEPQPGYELAKVYCGDQLSIGEGTEDVQPQPDGTYQYVLPADRIVNDLTTVAAIFNKKKEYDVNNDGEVTITDAVIIVDEILKE